MSSRTLTLATLAGAALLLPACGSDGGGSTATTADREAAALKWASCMREHGVDVPDPGGPGGPQRVRITGSRAKMEQAQQACEKYREAIEASISEEERTEMRDQALRFARCMREQGIDMPDPDTSGGIMFRKGSGVDPESPAFQRAQEACQDLRPKPPGR